MLNSATMLLRMRDAISKLMEKCEKITKKMATLVQDLTEDSGVTEQPSNIPDHLMLAKYQMIGLNWLVLMHKQSLNGILADEMGLGKTIQAISFLAHLKELGDEGPHLIIVPSSTMDNWQKEFKTWCPSMKVLNYYGSQDERRHMRVQIVQEQVEFDVILTTYNMVISSPEDRVLFRLVFTSLSL
jgi:SWI/SNF-related matrix-associated actin-dependent regulator 1 of chromatin subfamily A